MDEGTETPGSLRVLVIGGGIGGLCLAHGLKKAGVSCAVYERESATPLETETERYSIQINSDGNTALHECLPDDLWEAYLTTAGQPVAGIRFVTHRLRRLLAADWAPARDQASADWRVSRPKLRQVLLAGLEREVRFGKKLLRYERTPDEHVEAFFEDGTSTVGDVLVGADGVSSNVRKQFLPQASVRDLHVAAVGAKYRLTKETAMRLAKLRTDRMTIVLPPPGCGMFITQFVRQSRQEHPGSRYAELSAPDMEDHLFWALIACPETFGATRELKHLSPAELQDVALRTVHDWDPLLRRLVTQSDPATFTTIALHSADAVPEWETTNVTLLGDAIHTMTPLQGLGGNTALRDARLLCQALTQVDRGQTNLLKALGTYEAAMRGYGSEAIRVSLQYTRTFVSSSRVARAAFEGVLLVVDRIPPLKRKMFRQSPVVARSVRKELPTNADRPGGPTF
jgi:2-polyprenyl-6-methoxyphenol hydroxylase-like FAD-dependent oxidoreductase